MSHAETPELAAILDPAEDGAAPRPVQVPRRLPSLLLATTGLLGMLGGAAIAWHGQPRAVGISAGGGPEAKYAPGFVVVPYAPAFNDEREACGSMEPGFDYNHKLLKEVQQVGSEWMCCSICAGTPGCGAWTYGKQRGVDWLTDVCWLKQMEPGAPLNKRPKEGVVSGLPAPGLQKFGEYPAPASQTGKMDGVVQKAVQSDPFVPGKCPGSIMVDGLGQFALVNAGANTPGQDTGIVEAIDGDLVVPHMSGRTYFAQSCSAGEYDRFQYAAINLLGQKLSWTTDVSGTGCGCNAAFYLVSMAQNPKIGKCNDYYCDAMSVCGVACAEIDLQEANQYAWFSTLHAHNPQTGQADTLGQARGYGGSIGEPERRDWTSEQYGPGAACIDTNRPFRVSMSFPTSADSVLTSMDIELSQDGSPCTLWSQNANYQAAGHEAMAELTAALQAGMTPVISYWKSEDMLWMDGLGADGRGPCVKDSPDFCPDTVRFYGFSVEPLR